MQTTYQITGNDLAKALTGLMKPVDKTRDTSLQSEVMIRAHSRYRMYRLSNTKTKRVNGRWQNVPADYNAKDFAICLEKAWGDVKFMRSKAAWENGTGPRVAIDAATFEACRSDSAFTDRRGV